MTKKVPESKKQKVKSKKQATQSPIIDNQKSELEELTGDLQRVQAEFINYKTRVESEKATLSQFSKAQTIKELLPIIDDLERALSHLPTHLSEDKWALGVRSVYDRLLKQLEKLGVTKIDALGKPFDHNLHEAVQSEGDGEIQTVSEVLQNGYQMGDQIIRHAIVKVINS